jgi:hypothetical protein
MNPQSALFNIGFFVNAKWGSDQAKGLGSYQTKKLGSYQTKKLDS